MFDLHRQSTDIHPSELAQFLDEATRGKVVQGEVVELT